MLLQEHLQLFLECQLPVVLRLPLDVFRCVLDARNADAESTMTLLPLEIPMLLERVVNPLRRIAFEQLNGFRHGECGWDRRRA